MTVTHRMSKTTEYKSWQHMKDRCLNPHCQDYSYYGGRGITIHQPWIDSFEVFYEDMGEKPKGLTLERRNVNGNYEPSNCYWATRATQSINQRPRTDGNSKRKGVNYQTKAHGGKHWRARITRNRITHELGYYKTETEAALAYNYAAAYYDLYEEMPPR